MKPSKTQIEVLTRIAADWTLKVSRGGIDPSCFIQQADTAKSITVGFNTYFAMKTRGWIEESGGRYPITYYRITDAGRKALEAA